MASIFFRRSARKVYVYYQHPKTGRQTQVPRKLLKHLDGKPKELVEAWVRDWEEKHGLLRDRVERVTLKDTDKLSALWRQYLDFKDSDSPRRDRTKKGEDQIWSRHILTFFVGIHGNKEPDTWHSLVPQFHVHLAKQKLSPRSRQKILWTLKRFGEALVFLQMMTFPFAVRPPKSKMTKVTPLKVRKTPEDILQFCQTDPFVGQEIDLRLAVLLGYFGGFGPGELFALNKEDLLTGDLAESSSKTLEGFRRHGLGSRLSIVVNKTLPNVGKVTSLMKNDYRYGVSTIWDVRAAKLIATIVKDKPKGRLFPLSYSQLMVLWRRLVKHKLGATPHDLRRASGLYLGRVKRLELTLLQEHMRHAEIETTMLYTREPAIPDEPKKAAKQDFDDVA